MVAPAADDRLALAAQAAGLDGARAGEPEGGAGRGAFADGTDLIVAAHTHARVSNEALARSRLGGIGYHPSLLPRHRGIAAVEWTILEGDPIAGGSVYHLADGWDAGADRRAGLVLRRRGETARELWERALAPMGLALLARVVRHARDHGELPAATQDPRFATRAPMIRRAVVLTEDAPATTAALVVTVIGPDRPGIVSQHCPNGPSATARTGRRAAWRGWPASSPAWCTSRCRTRAPMCSPTSLRALESNGLHVGDRAARRRAARWSARLELRARRRRPPRHRQPPDAHRSPSAGISIENIHTEIVGGKATGKPTFKIGAHLLVPAALATTSAAQLGALASAMMVDVALDERPTEARVGKAIAAPRTPGHARQLRHCRL